MAAQIKSYFLAPNWDYQKNGPLTLGNIISDPTDPVFSRLSGFPPDMLANVSQPPDDAKSQSSAASAATTVEIHHNPPEQWSHVDSEMRAGRLGLFARFAEISGLGGRICISIPATPLPQARLLGGWE